jgi:MFS family permease
VKRRCAISFHRNGPAAERDDAASQDFLSLARRGRRHGRHGRRLWRHHHDRGADRPFEGEFGWLRAEMSLAYTLLTIGAAFGGLLAGRLADRLPTGPIAAAGALIIGRG